MVSLTQTVLHKIKKKYYPPLMFEYPIEDIGGELLGASTDIEGDDQGGDESVGDPELSKGGWWFNNRFGSFEEDGEENITEENIDF